MRMRGAGKTSAETLVPTERFREARHTLFMSRVVEDFLDHEGVPLSGQPISILDAGGSADYWKERGLVGDERFSISVLNLEGGAAGFGEGRYPGIIEIAGDATKLMDIFSPRQFDIVFSNSLIEHVGDARRQRAMADGVRQVGDAFWVQAPNYYSPLEPHFLSPLCPPYMPEWIRVIGARISPRGNGTTWRKARQELDSIRLLRDGELEAMFPDAEIVPERVYGFVKSWMVLRRRQQARDRAPA
jgi:hypothetical protein